MEHVLRILKEKSPIFILTILIYLCIVGLLTWGIKPPLQALWYLAGGLIGIFFLDIAEAFFRLTPSPFRSIVFAAAFAGVSFFVISSSGSMIAAGLVLSLYFTMILWQVGEWRVTGNLNSWYQMVAGPVPTRTQQWVLIAFVGLFLAETLLFIR